MDPRPRNTGERSQLRSRPGPPVYLLGPMGLGTWDLLRSRCVDEAALDLDQGLWCLDFPAGQKLFCWASCVIGEENNVVSKDTSISSLLGARYVFGSVRRLRSLGSGLLGSSSAIWHVFRPQMRISLQGRPGLMKGELRNLLNTVAFFE